MHSARAATTGDTCARMHAPQCYRHACSHAGGPGACHSTRMQSCVCHPCATAHGSGVEHATHVPRRTHAEGCVPPACLGTRMQRRACHVHDTAHKRRGACHLHITAHACRGERVTCMSRHTHAEVSVAPMCHLCASAHACRGECANTHVPPTPPVPGTCTGRRCPCQAGRGACAGRRGGRGTAPAPAPAPAARSAAGPWAGRFPLRESSTSAPAVPITPPTPAQSPILCARLGSHLARGRQGRCPGCPPRRGCRRLGGPSLAHSDSARGCCTPAWVTPAELSP